MINLSVILPVYNERRSIEKVIQEWQKELNKYKIDYQMIICEDGSTDGTTEFLKKIKKKYNLTLNQSKERRGYGKAVISGIKISQSKYILSIDSDGQCDPKDFNKFWKQKNKADVIIGWRTKRADPLQRRIYSFFFKVLFKLLFPVDIHDPSCPYVLYQREQIMPHLKYLKFLKEGFWWGFIGTAYKKNFSIHEIPINHRKRFQGDTVVYKINRIPSIVFRNILGLVRLKIKKSR